MRVAPQLNQAPQIVEYIKGDFERKFIPYQRIANAIIDQTLKTGDCLLQDLFPLGFDKMEAAELWHMAYAMADVELRLMKNNMRRNNLFMVEER